MNSCSPSPAWLGASYTLETPPTEPPRNRESSRHQPAGGPGVGPVQPGIAWSGLWLLVLLCACQSPVEPILVDMTPQRIVFRHAETAFAVAFDASTEADRNALERFHQTTSTATTRTDLHNAWVAIPALHAHGPDFLESRIFARAARDGDWPSGPPPADEQTVYVDAVRMAIESFLAGEEEDR